MERLSVSGLMRALRTLRVFVGFSKSAKRHYPSNSEGFTLLTEKVDNFVDKSVRRGLKPAPIGACLKSFII
jgi:hypothetical protein